MAEPKLFEVEVEVTVKTIVFVSVSSVEQAAENVMTDEGWRAALDGQKVNLQFHLPNGRVLDVREID